MNGLTRKEGFAAVCGQMEKIALGSVLLLSVPVFAQQNPKFIEGNLVVSVEGCAEPPFFSCSQIFEPNQAAMIALAQYAPSGTTSAVLVNWMQLPFSASGANLPIAGQLGSSSDGTLQLSGDGRFLTFMGYGVNYNNYNANVSGPTPSGPLYQSSSLTPVSGGTFYTVPRVVVLVDANGYINSTTALYNIFNTGDPHSIFMMNGSSAYVSGQGSGSDATGGVFYTPLGAPNMAPTPITGLDTTGNTVSQDTRDVQIVNNTLYVSTDTMGGSGSARSYVGTLGAAGTPPTATVGAPVMLTGYGNPSGTGTVSITSNGNGFNTGLQINTSPSNYYFANASTLYVADTGNPKNNTAASRVGDGGLQKWINTQADGSGTWNLAYTLYQGLNLVLNTSGTGTSGLHGLTGKVIGDAVELYATDATLSDLDPTHLYGITDTLSFTTASQASAETFNLLATSPKNSNFKGVSFAPTGPPAVTPTITWPAPAPIAYGTPLSDVQLNATANVPGTFTYIQPAGTVLSAVPQVIQVYFTPTDSINYTPLYGQTPITVTPTPANLIVQMSLFRSAGNVVVELEITNAGSTEAANVTLTGAKLGGVSTTTPLPLSVTTIGGGRTAIVEVTLPGSVGVPGAASVVSVSGTYAGASFGASERVTLP
jgi:hypothetical protein